MFKATFRLFKNRHYSRQLIKLNELIISKRYLSLLELTFAIKFKTSVDKSADPIATNGLKLLTHSGGESIKIVASKFSNSEVNESPQNKSFMSLGTATAPEDP